MNNDLKLSWLETWISTINGIVNECGYCCASCKSRDGCKLRCDKQIEVFDKNMFNCLDCKYD